MTLIDKIPEMSDEGLSNLLDNARRLASKGSAKQQAQASEILPALESAHEERRTHRLEAAAAKRAAKRPARKAA